MVSRSTPPPPIAPDGERMRRALEAMVREYGDYHYCLCPAEDDSGECGCAAGAIADEARAALSRADEGKKSDNLVPASGPIQPGDVLRYEVDEETRVGVVTEHLRPSDPTPPDATAQREAIAAFLLARDEDEFNPEQFMDWARNLIEAGKREKHSGDCTKESHSCVVCGANTALANADRILALQTRAGG